MRKSLDLSIDGCFVGVVGSDGIRVVMVLGVFIFDNSCLGQGCMYRIVH